jgi:hypothetical protein
MWCLNRCAVQAWPQKRSVPTTILAISVQQSRPRDLSQGQTTVKIRPGPTRRSRRVLILTAKTAAKRLEDGALANTMKIKALAALRGGMIGAAKLTARAIPHGERLRTRNSSTPKRPFLIQCEGTLRVRVPEPHPYRVSCLPRTLFFLVEGITPPANAGNPKSKTRTPKYNGMYFSYFVLRFSDLVSRKESPSHEYYARFVG